jgi:hypothetical protein
LAVIIIHQTQQQKRNKKITLLRIIIVTLLILLSEFCNAQTSYDNNISLSTNRISADSVVFHFRFYKELDLEIIIKDKSIIQYKLVNHDKSLNIKTEYKLYHSVYNNNYKPSCVTSYFLDQKDSVTYSKYFCNELVVVYDFNYEINLVNTSYNLEINYLGNNSNLIAIKILNEEKLPRYGYFINLDESTYEFGELRSIRRINREYENPEETGIIYTEIIESNMDKYGIWITKNFQNETIKNEEITYENVIEIK